MPGTHLAQAFSGATSRGLRAKFLTAADASDIDLMAAFSELIGNTDRHFENISILFPQGRSRAQVAPAYDILPMQYAPIGAGVDPDLRVVAPKIGPIGLGEGVWR